MINILTHNKNFHADEIMAITLLIKYYINGKEYKILRTRDKNLISHAQESIQSFVIDVGFIYDCEKLNFDHHQNDLELFWEDGTSFSSCGLIWKWLRDNKYLHQHMNNHTMDVIQETLIKQVDAHDNGESFWPVSDILCGFNRKTDNDSVIDTKFDKALKTAIDYYDNFLYNLKTSISEEKSIRKAILESENIEDIVISDCGIKSGPTLVSKYTNKKIFISPRTVDSWIISSVPVNPGSKNNRVSMPVLWRGISDNVLSDKQVIEGLIFCHKSGHMCMFKGSKEDAILFAKKIINS